MGITQQSAAARLIQPGVCTSTTRPASPYEGQAIFETDTDRMLIWNGTAWVIPNAPAQNPTGMELIQTSTVTSGTQLLCDNVFNSTYDNYRVVVSMVGVTNANILRFTLYNSSGTERTSGYFGTAWGVDYASGPTTLYSTGAQTTYMPLVYIGNAAPYASASFDVVQPFSPAVNTTITGTHTGINAGNWFHGGVINGVYNGSSETHRGFRLSNSGGTAMTGTVSVYGYRK